jgi:glycosyltransferase involved in cell wall biosynthesis
MPAVASKMKCRRILMVSGNAPPVMDGVGDCTDGLICELARQRPEWSWYWLCKRPRWFHSPVKWRDGLTMVRPNHSWSPRGIRLAQLAASALRPDLIHIQEQIHSFHESDATCRLADVAASRGIPLVTTLHEYHVELPSVRVTTELARRSTVIIANDPRNAERCVAESGRTPDHSWWSGGNVEPLAAAVRPSPVAGRLTTFGLIGGIKSLGLVGGALRLLRAESREIHWKIIGPFRPESDATHAAIAQDLGTDGIEFTGGFSVRDPRLQRLLAESEIMLLPYADGASERRSTLHVAWKYGLPVITTPPPIASGNIVDGVNCLFVTDPTPQSWAAAIRRVHSDRELADRLRAGSLASADQFSWKRLASLHLEMYDRLFQTTPGSA